MFGSIRHAEELSITVVPISANFGAHSKDVFPPAEKRAISGFNETASAKPITLYDFPLKNNSFPTDLSDATKSNSSTGKFLSSKTFNITSPTIPVAPTKANFIWIDSLIRHSQRPKSILENKIKLCYEKIFRIKHKKEPSLVKN